MSKHWEITFYSNSALIFFITLTLACYLLPFCFLIFSNKPLSPSQNSWFCSETKLHSSDLCLAAGWPLKFADACHILQIIFCKNLLKICFIPPYNYAVFCAGLSHKIPNNYIEVCGCVGMRRSSKGMNTLAGHCVLICLTFLQAGKWLRFRLLKNLRSKLISHTL